MRPSLLWMDMRSAGCVEQVAGTGDAALGVNSAGEGPVSAEWMIPKVNNELLFFAFFCCSPDITLRHVPGREEGRQISVTIACSQGRYGRVLTVSIRRDRTERNEAIHVSFVPFPGKKPCLRPCRILVLASQISANGNLLHMSRHSSSVLVRK